MGYYHDRSMMCVVGGCTDCGPGSRWIAADAGESWGLARAHELRAHPGEVTAFDGLKKHNRRHGRG